MSPYLYAPEAQVFDYKDVILVPKKGVLKTRSEADITSRLGKYTFNAPYIPANMSAVIDETNVYEFLKHNIFYIMHRFNIDTVSFVRKMHSEGHYSSISIGVQEGDKQIIRNLKEENLIPNYITIDIAHGHSETVINQISYIREILGDKPFIIAGNIATVEAGKELAEAGANAVKVGVAPGSACLTGPNTGFGSRGWQLSAMNLVAEGLKDTNVQVIADGGVSLPGDIAKSIAFGADFVMLGGLLSSHEDSPGKTIIDENGQRLKAYYGSASAEQKGNNTHVEGKTELKPVKGYLADTITELNQHLKSSVSYAGGRVLHDLREVQYTIIR